MSATLQMPGDPHPLSEPWEIEERLDRQVDGIVDSGAGTLEATTVIDLTGPVPEVLRHGLGPVNFLD